MSAIQRETSYFTVLIDAGTSESDTIQFYPYAGGMILIPSGWTSAEIGFKAAKNTSDTFHPVYDEDGALISISGVSINSWYSLPTRVFGARYLKLWSQSSSVSVIQLAERSINVMLKS